MSNRIRIKKNRQQPVQIQRVYRWALSNLDKNNNMFIFIKVDAFKKSKFNLDKRRFRWGIILNRGFK